jgi:hypothetical protein
MTVDAINAINAITGIDGASAASAVAPLPPAHAGLAPSAAPILAAADPPPRISRPGQLFSRLQELSQKDPAKFKEVTRRISEEIRESTAQSSGKAAELESALADRIASAAESGDLSSLKPPDPGDAAQVAQHHHHHADGIGAYDVGDGDAGPLRAIFSNALDEVNEALSGGDTPAPDAAEAPAADAPGSSEGTTQHAKPATGDAST